MVEAAEREVGAVLRQWGLRRAGLDQFLQPMAGRAAENDEVDQAVRAEAVRAVDRHARRLAHREQAGHRSEEHTSELQSLMRISYAVFCLKIKNYDITTNKIRTETS